MYVTVGLWPNVAMPQWTGRVVDLPKIGRLANL